MGDACACPLGILDFASVLLIDLLEIQSYTCDLLRSPGKNQSATNLVGGAAGIQDLNSIEGQGVTNVHLSNVHFVLRDISASLDPSWGS